MSVSTPVRRPLRRGQLVAPGYRVVAHLRRGNELDVYDVWSEQRLCRCIAKLPRPDASGSRTRARVVREGELLLSLSHPHLVRAHELLHEPQPTLVLETLGGATLGALLGPGERLAASDVAELGRQLCGVLHYLHSAGWLHLDVKPSNVVAEGGRARLLDLDLARPPGVWQGGIGTQEWMAPEQARGGELDAAADVWGLGLLLFTASTGVQPFALDDDDPDDRYRQLEQEAPRVRSLRRLPAPLAAVIDACLSPEPQRRPSTSQLHAALART